ncbi:MAG: DUF4105 domain-containing protein [Pseudomonadota bacterium]
MIKFALTLSIVLLLAVAVLWLNWHLRTPTHERDWQPLYATLPSVTKDGELYTITNVRDWSYGPDRTTTPAWHDVVIDPNALRDVYFLVKPFGNLEAVAHTMLAFEFSDGASYVASVEARRTVGQDYGGLKAGIFPMHEYMFVWATERDMYINNTIYNEDDLYLYKLELSAEAKRAVLIAMLDETAALFQTPRFYNTFFSNCTNVLARAVNKVASNAVPWHHSWHLPGLAPRFLNDLGLIAAPFGFEKLQQSAYITPIVADISQANGEIEFSKALRSALNYK